MADTFRIRAVDPLRLDGERAGLAARLRALLPSADVREVGSTAVEGAIGKGDLDFLVTVPRAEFAAARERLDAAFPRNPSQLSNEGFQGYSVPSELDVAIQLTVEGRVSEDFVRFLHILRSDAEVLAAYNTLKSAWDGKPMGDYSAQKARFIAATLRGR